VTINNEGLSDAMEPTLKRVAGPQNQPGAGWAVQDKITGAEDFSFFDREAPGLYFVLGVTPPDQMEGAAANHSPRFFVHEPALVQGVRALANLTVDYMAAPRPRARARR
jgi:amidohydrolase